MITRYRIGTPFDTESVVVQLPVHDGALPGWETDAQNKCLTRTLAKSDIVYGLGESVRGINKRGWLYTSNNSDDPHHEETKHSLYASQNFVIVFSPDTKNAFGLYVDAPGKINFDIAYTDPDVFSISFEDFDADLYLVAAGSLKEIVREFRGLIGRSYIPPKWAFGLGQSRWSYMTADEVREVADSYDEAGIPLDMIYLDIDYMERYKDFTVNEEAFPDFEAFVKEMKDRGIHLVPIIDAGVKIEEGYPVYEEGIEKGYFCKKENGEELVAAVWPGTAHFPDFLNEDARRWFGDWYGFLTEKGIDGFWNDMNEPAIFYTADHLKEVFEGIRSFEGKNMDLRTFFGFKGLVASLENNPEDYRRFYHDFHGQKVRHDKVHNLFGYYMTRAAGEAFTRLRPGKRTLMFSRSSYIGMHRYGGVWTGDNQSWWSHILLNLRQLPALNMCGFMYSGADLGGFGQDCTEDLVLRWLSLGIFTPLMRDHAAMGTRRQELYRFKNTEAFRNIVGLRYALIPYLYSEFMKAVLKNDMLFLPLSFEFPDDERALTVEDQLYVGESIMIAPVYEQNARGRYVYLPERMKLLRFRSASDFDEEILEKGDHYVPADLNEVLVFLRPGHVLPLAASGARRVDEINEQDLTWFTFEGRPEEYELYTDDGISAIN